MFKQRQYKPLAYLCNHKLEDGRRCNRGFRNRSGLTQHVNVKHRTINTIPERHRDITDANVIIDENVALGPNVPDDTAGVQPASVDCTINKHPLLDGKVLQVLLHNSRYNIMLPGTPCDHLGRDLPAGAPPPVADQIPSYEPFRDRADFELAEFFYMRNQTPAAQIDALMDIWASKLVDQAPPFIDHKDLYQTIDSIKHGDVAWKSFSVSYCGEDKDDIPWMKAEYEVWYRDPLTILENQLANPDFDQKFHTAPYRKYNENGERVWSDLLSGNWAWKQAVSYQLLNLYMMLKVR